MLNLKEDSKLKQFMEYLKNIDYIEIEKLYDENEVFERKITDFDQLTQYNIKNKAKIFKNIN